MIANSREGGSVVHAVKDLPRKDCANCKPTLSESAAADSVRSGSSAEHFCYGAGSAVGGFSPSIGFDLPPSSNLGSVPCNKRTRLERWRMMIKSGIRVLKVARLQVSSPKGDGLNCQSSYSAKRACSQNGAERHDPREGDAEDEHRKRDSR